MSYKIRVKRTVLIMLLPIVSYGLLGPLEIYFGNQKDFSFGYRDFLGIFVVGTLIVWMIVSLIFALLPNKINRILNGFVLGIGLASYIQNMFMNIKLSENDGSPMRWEEMGNFTIINLVIWIGIIVMVLCACVFLKKYWDYISMGTAAFLSAIQLVAIISLLIPAMLSGKEGEKLQIATMDRFYVANENNVIVFVLDTLGNTQYENALKQYPDLADGLSDFTFYNNTDCHYYCTFPSMTHMLTGIEFDFNAVSEEWMETAWNSEKAANFYQILHSKGYTCNLYSATTGYVYGDLNNLYGKFDNIQEVETKTDRFLLVKKLGKMSIYRYVPYVLKPYFEVLSLEFDGIVSYIEGENCVDDNGEFYQLLLDNSLQIDSQMENAFIIQHLFGTHEPYTLNERAEIVESADVNETIKGLMVIVNEYLQQMKEIGVYDKATIIIMADHGSWVGGDPQPIFFIKRSGESHDEQMVSTAPISLDDFQATVLSVIGEDYSEYGTSIFDWEEGVQRERSVYMRMTDEDYPDVEGSSWNVYYKYKYLLDKNELNTKISQGPEEILPATPWREEW